MKIQVFVVGPGYVGREIIDLLLTEGRYEITALVRREAAAKDLENDGVKTILGDANDVSLVQKLSALSDVIFHVAGSDHEKSVRGILEGIEERASRGKRTIYLHQSGAGVLSDTSLGNNVNNEVYSDTTTTQIDALSNTAPHRSVDLSILKTRQDLGTNARIFIFMPPIIYGNNSKYKRLSIQIPALTRFACSKGKAGYVGTGAWGVVHVLDLAKAYVQILHWAETAEDTDPELQNPYFFCENGETTWDKIGSTIGKGLYNAGRIHTPTPQLILQADYPELFGQHTLDALGCNCRNRADRLRVMGWEPQQLGFDEAFETEDLPVILSEKIFE